MQMTHSYTCHVPKILLSRQLRRFLTGDLTSPVIGYPRFAYPESALLRATVARIGAATHISPKGYYTVEEQGGEDVMVGDQEYEAMVSAWR